MQLSGESIFKIACKILKWKYDQYIAETEETNDGGAEWWSGEQQEIRTESNKGPVTTNSCRPL